MLNAHVVEITPESLINPKLSSNSHAIEIISGW